MLAKWPLTMLQGAYKQAKPPAFIAPPPCALGESLIGSGWIHEVKHDGFRIREFHWVA
jgi:ATP-dependent DNA ligase